mgnify:CR=1 FL=1
MPSPAAWSWFFSGILKDLGATVVLAIVLAGFLTPPLAIGSVLSADAVNIAKSLPAYMQNIQLQSASTMYGKKNGVYTPFATFYDENRVPGKYNQMSSLMRHAVISIEDPRFYQHGGVDFLSSARALVQNQVAGGIQSGSSTITMQLVRTELVEAAVWSNNKKAIANARVGTLARNSRQNRPATGTEHPSPKTELLTAHPNSIRSRRTTHGPARAPPP